MKKTIIILLSTVSLVISSCGHATLKSKEDAIKFIEKNAFYDNDAGISGKGGGELASPFSIKFENGNAIIGEESMPYTISELIVNGNAPTYNSNQFNGFEIQFCGSERYAYGGCIKCYLNSGLKSKNGPALHIFGDYVKAYCSYITDGAIKKK